MSYRFNNTNGIIGKKLNTSAAGGTVSSGIFTMNDQYERALEGTWPNIANLRYNPRFHNATTNPGAAYSGSSISGNTADKDMIATTQTESYPASFHPDGSTTSLTGYAFKDMGDDLFDAHFGCFTLYIPSSSTSITIPFSVRNQADGIGNMHTETFTGGGKTFQIKHGYPDVGVFAFRIINQTDETTPFQLLFAGKIGSDTNSHNRMTEVDAPLNSPYESTRIHFYQNLQIEATDTDHNFVSTDGIEMFQIAVIPMRASEYGIGTNTNQILTNTPTTFTSSRAELDPQHFKTSAMTVGFTFYMTKGDNLVNSANYIAADLNREVA